MSYQEDIVTSEPLPSTSTNDVTTVALMETTLTEKPEKPKPTELSEDDLKLLNAIVTDEQHIHIGKFLTLQRRRRRRLITAQMKQEMGLLDDVQYGPVKSILQQAAKWNFNAFSLDNITGGRALPVFCLHLFQRYGLLKYFKLDPASVWKLFTLIEEGYHSTNPYHNTIHAADVTQAMHSFIQQEKILEHLKPIEIMAALIGAAAHDMDHPGVNQPFLIATSNHLAALYQNSSVLENHHWRSGIGCVIESGIAAQLSSYWPELEQQTRSLILATDITRQQEFLSKFKKFVDASSYDLEQPEDRHLILQIALKCADISNPCRPWKLSRQWSTNVCEEFFRQGFLKFIVRPLVSEWHSFLNSPLSEEMLINLDINQSKWEEMLLEDENEKQKTEAAIAELMEIDIDNAMAVLPAFNDTTKADDGRRFSVPADSVPKTGNPSRRESSPGPSHLAPGETIADFEKLSFRDSQFLFHSSMSLNRQTKSTVVESEEQMVAQSLLPQHSITSITKLPETNRISFVLHGPPVTKILVRQNTDNTEQIFSRARCIREAEEMGIVFSTENSVPSSSNTEQIAEIEVPPKPPSPEQITEIEVPPKPPSPEQITEIEVPPKPPSPVNSTSEDTLADDTDNDASEPLISKPATHEFEYVNVRRKVIDPMYGAVNYRNNRRSSAPTTSFSPGEMPRLVVRRCSVPVSTYGYGHAIEGSINEIDEDCYMSSLMDNMVNSDSNFDNAPSSSLNHDSITSSNLVRSSSRETETSSSFLFDRNRFFSMTAIPNEEQDARIQVYRLCSSLPHLAMECLIEIVRDVKFPRPRQNFKPEPRTT